MAKFISSANTAETSAKKKPDKKSSAGKILETVFLTLYRLRKIVMAIPVIYLAFRLAFYNESHLPVEVGLFLQNNGCFLRMIDRGTAVLIPLFLTLGCLVLMMFSRKAMYAWAISIFSLALPILLLISNIYPA